MILHFFLSFGGFINWCVIFLILSKILTLRSTIYLDLNKAAFCSPNMFPICLNRRNVLNSKHLAIPFGQVCCRPSRNHVSEMKRSTSWKMQSLP
jgi:hypothetical protein